MTAVTRPLRWTGNFSEDATLSASFLSFFSESESTHKEKNFLLKRQIISFKRAGPRSAVSSASDTRVRGPGFDTRSGHILSFLLPLIQEEQLSVTGESMCMKYWLTA